MHIGVIGAGYVGLVTGTCLAEMGNVVTVVDNDPRKIECLLNGKPPHYEPGLEELLVRNRRTRRLSFSMNVADAVSGKEAVFLAVGTPQSDSGKADLTYLEKAAGEVAACMDGYRLIVIKSTVPPGTNRAIEKLIKAATSHPFDVVSNPEFLKEGAAVEDFLRPDRVVAGVRSERARVGIRTIYQAFFRIGHRLLETDPESAEMIKYTSNVLLANRISMMNEIAAICHKVGADVEAVRVGAGLDKRLGAAFLYPGLGYGGSCFPKDVKAFAAFAESLGGRADICRAVDSVNSRQVGAMVDFIEREFGTDLSGKVFALWGLAYKPRTDDVRESPALKLASEILARGGRVRGFDPEAGGNAKAVLPGLDVAEDDYSVLDGADALVLCTEWNEFRSPDWDEVARRLRRKLLFDGRNLYQPATMAEHGFVYYSIGRRPVGREG